MAEAMITAPTRRPPVSHGGGRYVLLDQYTGDLVALVRATRSLGADRAGVGVLLARSLRRTRPT
jgi:hypothetical protein